MPMQDITTMENQQRLSGYKFETELSSDHIL